MLVNASAERPAPSSRPAALRAVRSTGRSPAGRDFPKNKLPKAYRDKPIRFSKEGYPDFTPYAKQLPGGKKVVNIKMTGSRADDFAAANRKAGFKQTPEDYTWHHRPTPGEMELIPTPLHDAVDHTGGVATFKHHTGVDYAP